MCGEGLGECENTHTQVPTHKDTCTHRAKDMNRKKQSHELIILGCRLFISVVCREIYCAGLVLLSVCKPIMKCQEERVFLLPLSDLMM